MERIPAVLLVERKSEETPTKLPENKIFQVFLGFKKPCGYSSLFGQEECRVYTKLAEIFKQSPRVIYAGMQYSACGRGDAFMQEYLTIEEASEATGKASLFIYTSNCLCFYKQEGFFYIKETETLG